jgi:hypothetical protein
MKRLFFAIVVFALSSHAASKPTLSASVEQEILPEQTVSITAAGYTIELKAHDTKVGEFTSTVTGTGSQKLYGAVRQLDYRIVKGKAQAVVERVKTLGTNVKGMPTSFEKQAQIKYSRWGDDLVLADEVPLPANSFWEIRQELFLDGQKLAQFRIRFTPQSVTMVSEPFGALVSATQ